MSNNYKSSAAPLPMHTANTRSHIAGAFNHLKNDSDELREVSPEQVLFKAYEDAGQPHGPVLYAVKGEHWNGVSPGFLNFINNFKFKPEDMGYAECGYGIQRHRDFMRQLILAEHELGERRPPKGLDIDVGCLAMTTRMAMYDFGKVAFRHAKATHPEQRPVALVPTPAWDYRGVFKDIGFEIVYLPIRPENGWQPDLSEWRDIAKAVSEDPERHLAITISNPQHNPTGKQWASDVTAFLLELSARESAYLLIDDAYYNVHDPLVPVENHLRVVLELFDVNNGVNDLVRSGMFDRWVATRPFGKQFSCNTMGVAAITTSPVLLRQLGRESWINRYHCNTHNAELMCAWLAEPESADWTLESGLRYTAQKEHVRRRLVERMGWPKDSVCVGPSTSYMLFEVPKVYQAGAESIDRFRDDLFYATGTLISASLFNQAAPAPYVRLHLGSWPDVIEEFLRRWEAAGLNYHQVEPFPGTAAMSRALPSSAFREKK
ncbi:MAG: aminotransferase [unclassified Hahellaceae]|nr:aminotransferase [Hahellaceae bacterium]|tara:strand:+ start:63387 stop:64856 length:1470 start_codon:yes stop_codon:yes gene_type:complete